MEVSFYYISFNMDTITKTQSISNDSPVLITVKCLFSYLHTTGIGTSYLVFPVYLYGYLFHDHSRWVLRIMWLTNTLYTSIDQLIQC